MIKRIHCLSVTLIVGAIGTALMFDNDAKGAGGTYKLEYPANYGCQCVPNVLGYGHFKTQWRQWPCEQRLDQTYPKALGAEPLPRTPGYETLPLPRKKLQDLVPSTLPGEGEQPSLPPFEPGMQDIPGGPATPPGGETLPGLPPEPGGFNPVPGLPPDLNIPGLDRPANPPGELPKENPAPLNNNENPLLEPPKEQKEGDTPAVSRMKIKSDSPKKGVFNPPSLKNHDESGGLKTYVPVRLPEVAPFQPAAENPQAMLPSRPQANWNSALEPGVYAETSRSGAIHPSAEFARQADYQAPAESNTGQKVSDEILEQSFEQPLQPEGRVPSAITADSRPITAPPTALKGYCPVELCRSCRWVQGDPRWTVIHQGVSYRLSGNDQRIQFLANPQQFVPENGGNDPVISANQRRDIPGDLTYCAAFKGRIYMFSSAATQSEFQKNPERYISAK